MSRCIVRDPVHQDADGSWYFYDETWSDTVGPYPTEKYARERLKDYGEYLTTGKDPAKERSL